MRGISCCARLVISLLVSFLLYNAAIAFAVPHSEKKHAGQNKSVKKKKIAAHHKRHVARKAKNRQALKRKIPNEAEQAPLRPNRALTQEEEQKLLKEQENKINRDIIE